MTTKLHWQTEGQGSDLVLIHGWGMNGAVWQQVLPLLTPYFRVHCVDLPGYGHSASIDSASIEELAHLLLEYSPTAATWVGWSLGGLVATQAALLAPERVNRLVTVASSPKFAADKATSWRGIQPRVLTDFQQQLSNDFRLTIERFMALQAMGSPTARQDIKLLKQAVLSRPQPNSNALSDGLIQLAEVDLREQLAQIQQPWLRMYGRLDGLVPVKIAQELDELAPQSQRQVFAAASHAPFISHPVAFTQALRHFVEAHDD